MQPAFLAEMKPVKIGELCFAMELIQRVMDGQLPTTDPSELQFSVSEDDGTTKQYQLGDVPLTRSLMAIRDYVDDPAKAASLHLRSWAFRDMVRDSRIERWKPQGSIKGQPAPLHGAVLAAAAEIPLNAIGSFDPDEFFARVEAIAEQYSMEQINEMMRDGWQEIPEIPEPAEEMFDPFPGFVDEFFIEQSIGVERIGRNQPCPCGSGKKYKKCCYGKN